jgi:hypothetical protein
MLLIPDNGLHFDAPLSRLTRPQIQFIIEVNTYKAQMMSGKGKKGMRSPGTASKGPRMAGTPEEIARMLYPKMKAQEKKSRDAEVAVARAVMEEWEARNKRGEKK